MSPFDVTFLSSDPAAHTAPPRRMSEDEFVAWCDEDVRAEWIDGEVIIMSPARDDHVDLDVWLLSILRAFVERADLGAVRGPQLAVRFAGQRRRRVPDVLFISRDRLDIIRLTHVEGAPDLIMEIVSPDSQSRDWREKYLEYEAAGVREYWIFDPAARRAEAYRLADGRYARIAEADDRIASVVLPGFFIRPPWLPGEKLPKLMDVLVELNVVRPNAAT